jgi:Holliday junction resolvasome RuvABC endonuclease subunit
MKIINKIFVYLGIIKIIKVMSEFEENNPEQLRQFLKELNELVDKYHPNIYLLDKVFAGLGKIEVAISNELNK